MSAYGHAAPGPGLSAPRVTLRAVEHDEVVSCRSRVCLETAEVVLTVALGPARYLCDAHAKPATKAVRDGVYDVLIGTTVIGRVERCRAGFDPRWDAITTEPRRLSAFNIHSRRDAVARLIEELSR